MKKITLFVLFLIVLNVNAQTISHSTAMTLGTTNVACNAGTGAAATSSDNRYFRFFELAGFSIAGTYNVSSVQFGVQTINIPTLPAGFPVIVKIYSTTAADFPTGYPTGYTELASVTTNFLAADAGTLVTVPITGSIPFGSNLLVEVGYAAATAASANRIFLSANDLGQTAPTYISSTGCSILPPTTMASINFPNAHLVLSVTGTTLGLNENSLEIATVFPNPSKGIYTIDLKNSATIEKISLTDLTGKQTVISLDANNSFDISSYATGVYILNLQTSEGVMNKRLIKE